ADLQSRRHRKQDRTIAAQGRDFNSATSPASACASATTAKTIPPRINPAPNPWMSDNSSPQYSHDVNVAKTGSKQSSSDARIELMKRWARICQMSANAVEKTAVKTNAPINGPVHERRSGSNSAAARPAPTAVPGSWSQTRRRASKRLENSETATICPPKTTAVMRVHMSPRLRPPPEGLVRQ